MAADTTRTYVASLMLHSTLLPRSTPVEGALGEEAMAVLFEVDMSPASFRWRAN